MVDDSQSARARRALKLVASALVEAGWHVDDEDRDSYGAPDLRASRGLDRIAVELKVAPEGRRDRLVPLWSQALLQAQAAADGAIPVAIVAAPRVPPQVADQVLDFAREHVPHAGAGVIDLEGLRRFRGPMVESLDAPSQRRHGPPANAPPLPQRVDLFSDLNQWMLKVLLAPRIPAAMLEAPRERYEGPSQLAAAARVSPMSAHRLVRQLESDGFLERRGPALELVRREALLQRWQAAVSARPPQDLPMRFLLGGDKPQALHRALREHDACLALFAAADELGVGAVHGVPPYVYVRNINQRQLAEWRNVVPAAAHEAPHFILRRAAARESVFRGAVHHEGVLVADVLQVWLDVSSHPSRGPEQGDRIWRKVFRTVIAEG